MSGKNRAPRRSAEQKRDIYHHGDLKRALTDSALVLVAEKGPKGFSLSEAARRVGVSVAAPYRHFRDKAELLAAVAEQGFLQLHATLVDAGDSESGPHERIIEMGRGYVRWAVAHPDHYQVMFGGEIVKPDHPALLGAATRAFDDLLDAIAMGLGSGMLRGRDAREMAGPVWSLVHGIASLAIGGDLRHVGIRDDPETLAGRSLAQLLGFAEADSEPASSS
jgi:AcrR family transcriptional regulator